MTSRRQLAAIVALVSSGALVAVVAGFLLSNATNLALGIVGLCVTVAGGWWLITERMPRRAVGAVAAGAGAAVIGVALARAFGDVDRVALRLALVIAVFVIASVSARVAMMRDVDRADVRSLPRSPPRHPVLLCNPWSGGGKVERFGIVDLARELGVETVVLDRGLDLEQLARDAVARGADCLGMAGGDGSQALVASIAVEHDLPFVCVSAGTRNHFALDLGLERDDPRKTMYAFRDAVERRVDYATVGDRFFVNNVSLGVYATIVQEDEYRDAKIETTRAKLPEVLGQQAEQFDLQLTTPDGREVDGAILVMVSNNVYVIGASLDAAQRRRLDAGVLGVFAVNVKTGADAARLAAHQALGRRTRSPYWHEFTATEFEVRSRSGSVRAGIDGESLELPTPLHFRIHPLGLRLLVPAGNVDEALRRQAREVRVRDLLTIAAGREPSA